VTHRVRKGRLLCATCAGDLRSKGQGPIQLRLSEASPNPPPAPTPTPTPAPPANATTAVPMELTLDQFIEQAPYWYDIYARANATYFPLEKRLTEKATSKGYLEIADLVNIPYVLGNPRNIRGRMQGANIENDVIENTKNAIKNLDNPTKALKYICSIKYWGLTYGSKTLRCMCPQKYGALDSVVINGIDPKYLPSRNNYDKYADFIHLCGQIRDKVIQPGRRENGQWFIADIEMALFQFLCGRSNKLLYSIDFVHRPQN
jgi:hypothetical protein